MIGLKFLVFVILVFLAAPVLGLPIDTTSPLSNLNLLNVDVTIVGTFHYVRKDTNHQYSTGDTDYYYPSTKQIHLTTNYPWPPWTPWSSNDGVTFKCSYSDRFITQVDVEATIDTLSRRIKTFHYLYFDGDLGTPSSNCLIVLHDLLYSAQSISFPDSNILSHVDTVRYASFSSFYYPGRPNGTIDSLFHLEQLKIFNTVLSGVSREPESNAASSIISHRGGFRYCLPRNREDGPAVVYSVTGVKLREQQPQVGDAYIDFEGLPVGLYFLRYNSQFVKCAVLEN